MREAASIEGIRSLSHAERIDALVKIQRRRAVLDAEEQRLLAVIEDDPTPDPQRRELMLGKEFVREEVACALRIAPGTARSRLHVAHTLAHRLADTLDALAQARITYWHCRVLVDATRDLDQDLASLLEERVLPQAGEQTVGEFRAAVKRLLQQLDPADAADRHQRAAQDRRVECFDGPDGMSTVWALLPTPDAAAVVTALDTAAGRHGPDDERTMDQRRADTAVFRATCRSVSPARFARGDPSRHTASSLTLARGAALRASAHRAVVT